MESNNNNIPDDEVDDDIINDTIETLENYLFGKSGDCGEKLFIDFAKNNKQHFIDAKLGQSTENNFEFSEYNDPIAFGLYSKDDFSKLKLLGLKFDSKKAKLDRDDLKKIRFSNISIFLFIVFYGLMICTLLVD